MNKLSKKLMSLKKIQFSFLQIIFILLIQQLWILTPYLRLSFNVHKWNDDFTVFNEWTLKTYPLNMFPSSVNLWVANVRSRAYMPEFLVNAYRILGRNEHLFLMVDIACWLIALILLAYLFAKILNTQGALIATLFVGSSPYRQDFFPFMQGSGYTVVFLLFSISAVLLYHSYQSSNEFVHRIYLGSAVSLLYLSFYFFEIGIIAVGFFSIMILFFAKHSPLVFSRRKIFFEASLFLAIGAIHASIILSSPVPIWNRSSISNISFSSISSYLHIFSVNYLNVLLNPFVWIFSKNLLASQLFSLVRDFSFSIFGIAFFVFLFKCVQKILLNSDNSSSIEVFSKVALHFRKESTGHRKYFDKGHGQILFASVFLILSPLIGFLTFAGGCPVRLTLLSIPGFAIIFALFFTYCHSLTRSPRNRTRLLYLFLLLPILFSSLAAYQSRAIASVSTYDNELEGKLLRQLPPVSDIKFPIILNFAISPCAATGFWGPASGGSIWSANSGQLNLANDLHLLDSKDSDLSRTIYIPKSVPLPDKFSSISSRYCKSGRNQVIPDNLLPNRPKFNPRYSKNLQYYIDPNLKITQLLSGY